MYASTEQAAVNANTERSLIRRVSAMGSVAMQMAVITSKLKEAEPTIVLGPSSPAVNLSTRSSTTERRISGAEDPKAMSERLATVAFHTRIVLEVPSRA